MQSQVCFLNKVQTEVTVHIIYFVWPKVFFTKMSTGNSTYGALVDRS